MAKRKPAPQGQLNLFPEMGKGKVKSPGQNFAEKLVSQKLVAARVQRRRLKEGSPKTINVVKEISNATTVLRQVKGVNLEALRKMFKEKGMLNLDLVLKSGIVASVERSPADQRKMRNALRRIIYFVNRNKERKMAAKGYAPSKAQLAEDGRQKRHLKSIGQK